MVKGCEDYHTSKTKLNLGDDIRKPGKESSYPSPSKHCAKVAKKCATEQKGGFMDVIGELPGPIRTFGPKQYQSMSQFRTSAVIYGITSFLAICYICEWKAILQYLPYYNGKYKEDDK